MDLNPDVLFEILGVDLEGLVPVSDRSALPPDADTRTVAATCLATGFLKKLEVESDACDSAAQLKFLQKNYDCSQYTPLFTGDEEKILFNQFKVELDNFFHPGGVPLVTSYLDILQEGNLGPGSNVGANGQSFYAKMFASELTTTTYALYELYSAFVALLPSWGPAELHRSTVHGLCTLVSGSRSTFVPKDRRTSRLICVEPTLNMYFQKGIASILERRLQESFKISLEDQPSLNRELARVGSISGAFCTIDLESASDSISNNLLREVLPDWFFQLLMETRSPVVEVPGLGDVQMHMVSTMGNGFTFPLQSILFACALRAVYRCYGIPVINNHRNYDLSSKIPGNWGVFGDDLICVKDSYHALVGFLHALGFKVNSSKSFFEGPFRESCGHDYHSGSWVRAVYIKRLYTLQDITVAINLLNDWSARTGIVLSRTVAYLRSFLKDPLYVPFCENDDSGIRVPSSFFALSRVGGQRYRTYRAKPKQLRVREDGVVHAPKGCKKLSSNPDGLLISFLRGEIKSHTISIRSDVTRYETKRAYVPSWDGRSSSMLHERNMLWPQWETATLRNLGVEC